MNILFWNLGRKSLENEIVDLALTISPDMMVFAENKCDNITIVKKLLVENEFYHIHPNIGCERITVISKFPPSHLTIKKESDKYTIRKFSNVESIPIIFAFVHLSSKLYSTSYDQSIDASFLKQDIEDLELESNHDNTIVIGDFNMNPFDNGMISAHAFHSIPCLHTANKLKRTIDKRDYKFFYNPTWNLLGDNCGVPGTYFFNNARYSTHYWHLLDQVILRPSISLKLDKKSLKILTESNRYKFTNRNGKPKSSDHLPIFFSINIGV